MEYAKSLYGMNVEGQVYRCYVTDALAAYLGIRTRYYDIVNPPEDFDAQAVIDDVISRGGLEVR